MFLRICDYTENTFEYCGCVQEFCIKIQDCRNILVSLSLTFNRKGNNVGLCLCRCCCYYRTITVLTVGSYPIHGSFGNVTLIM